ncbi:hypothetical protein LTS07_009346 [Exophiala sideris]|uniref:Transcription factor domain-containing protein n=1 Tax=Exophiala sideris TaxID=1016849 RepID=A0ABR0J1C6_9EURO|nr:hypothetical protein LTS07_009346 [Exophiala sideris]KAK5028155.1 hypothetical protein LTR13_009143 [Exophiala sideris]KAK5052812.1 hypothetical protein LTR69_009638 [Exophiala sideris]KAK5178424.1 hypothetical protein LTR44_009049 [Eurotiomycetes sp. CCFEE 6388]
MPEEILAQAEPRLRPAVAPANSEGSSVMKDGRFVDGAPLLVACARDMAFGVEGVSVGSPAASRASTATATSSPSWTACISILTIDIEEGRYYDWFRCRTARKIPGMFISASFWNAVVFQACLSEPAVLHAALTLSCVHKSAIGCIDEHPESTCFTGEVPEYPNDNLDDQETFLLQQYLKAIGHLSPLLSKRDRSSVRTALIACVLFVCLEFLRGHFQTAQAHLQNGLKVLAERPAGDLTGANSSNLSLQASRESIDDHIVEALYRLHVQVELFNSTYQHPCLVLQEPCPASFLSRFDTVRDASKAMDGLMNRVVCLSQQAFQQETSQEPPSQHPFALSNCQRRINAELRRWLDVFEASANVLRKEADVKPFVCELLRGYHTMAIIMAGTCLRGHDETIFDSYTERFAAIVDEFSSHRDMRPAMVTSQPAGRRLNMTRSVIDIGWIPPLYYTALKCRVHKVRLQAVRLLESTSHREGIWDSRIVACVCRKVMELEGATCHDTADTRDKFERCGSLNRQDTLMSTVPQSCRINEVKVVLPNGPTDSLLLMCRQRLDTGVWKEWTEEDDSSWD